MTAIAADVLTKIAPHSGDASARATAPNDAFAAMLDAAIADDGASAPANAADDGVSAAGPETRDTSKDDAPSDSSVPAVTTSFLSYNALLPIADNAQHTGDVPAAKTTGSHIDGAEATAAASEEVTPADQVEPAANNDPEQAATAPTPANTPTHARMPSQPAAVRTDVPASTIAKAAAPAANTAPADDGVKDIVEAAAVPAPASSDTHVATSDPVPGRTPEAVPPSKIAVSQSDPHLAATEAPAPDAQPTVVANKSAEPTPRDAQAAADRAAVLPMHVDPVVVPKATTTKPVKDPDSTASKSTASNPAKPNQATADAAPVSVAVPSAPTANPIAVSDAASAAPSAKPVDRGDAQSDQVAVAPPERPAVIAKPDVKPAAKSDTTTPFKARVARADERHTTQPTTLKTECDAATHSVLQAAGDPSAAAPQPPVAAPVLDVTPPTDTSSTPAAAPAQAAVAAAAILADVPTAQADVAPAIVQAAAATVTTAAKPGKPADAKTTDSARSESHDTAARALADAGSATARNFVDQKSIVTQALTLDAKKADGHADPVPASPAAAHADSNSATSSASPNAPAVQPAQQAATPSQPVHDAAAPQAAANTAAPAAPAVVANAQTAVNSASAPVTAQLHIGQADARPDVNALAFTIATKSEGGTKHFDIRLDPAELGGVDVRLTVDSTGKAQALLTVEKPQTLALLQNDQSHLQTALKDAGLNLAQNGLAFSLKGQQQQQSGNDGRGASNARGRTAAARAVAAVGSAQSNISLGTVSASDTRLDIRV